MNFAIFNHGKPKGTLDSFWCRCIVTIDYNEV